MSEVQLAPHRAANSYWKWGVCGLLLLATMVNYMDRLTLNQSSKRVMDDIQFHERGYGGLEAYFGLAFAVGAMAWGWLVDRVNVRWVYPGAVFLWSLAGAATGFARTYDELLWCRIALGFFESANWPCALRTTQRLLQPSERTMGNSILQSGAAVGSVITPLVILAFVQTWANSAEPSGGIEFLGAAISLPRPASIAWRGPFWFVGALGLVWVAVWLLVVRSEDLSLTTPVRPVGQPGRSSGEAILNILADRRFWALIFLVVAINAAWHFFRAWMPLYLQTARGYSDKEVSWFSMGYYVAADLGAMSAGFMTLFLIRRGGAIHASRLCVYLVFALLALLSIPAAFTDNGMLMVVLFTVVGFAALGVFPNYYSFTQDLTTQHQGKVTGMLSFACWGSMFVIQKAVGVWVESSKMHALAGPGIVGGGLMEPAVLPLALQGIYAPLIACAGLLPILGFLAVLVLWRQPAVVRVAHEPEPVGKRLAASELK